MSPPRSKVKTITMSAPLPPGATPARRMNNSTSGHGRPQAEGEAPILAPFWRPDVQGMTTPGAYLPRPIPRHPQPAIGLLRGQKCTPRSRGDCNSYQKNVAVIPATVAVKNTKPTVAVIPTGVAGMEKRPTDKNRQQKNRPPNCSRYVTVMRTKRHEMT